MPDQNLSVDALFELALEISSIPERQAFLDRSCGDNSLLRERLERLLGAADRFRVRSDSGSSVLNGANVSNQLTSAMESPTLAGYDSVLAEANTNLVHPPGESVLKKMLGESLQTVPLVLLKDSADDDLVPVVRLHSSEAPARDPHSRYQLQGEIARGGMGAILKGRDIDLGRDLAIKVLLDQHRHKPEIVQRFIEEAQIGGQLQHPGIAPVYELGQFVDRRPYFSMKLVKGETLAALLARRSNSEEDRGKYLGIFEQICQTMAYAHSRGVIHRDLKPANVMVGAFGEVQVMDWGLAKVLAAGGIADEKRLHQQQTGHSEIHTLRTDSSDVPGRFGTQTQMGSVMGTPAYMPPEQALGEIDQLDQRSDVFGLGAILAEILTGKPPYVASDSTQVFRLASRGRLKECYERLECCGADADLITLARDCLQAEPAHRPNDAGALAARVTEYLESAETRLRDAELRRATEAARADAQAAQAEAERQRADAERRRAEAEQQRAESEGRRLDQQQRSAYRLRRLTAGLAVVALLAIGACTAALVAQQEARRLADVAANEAGHARENARIADYERDLALAARRAEEKIASQAQVDREVAQRESYRSTIKLAESMLQGDKPDRDRVADILWDVQPDLRSWEWGHLMARCPLEQWALKTGHNRLLALASSTDGRYLATAGTDGTVALWNSWTQQEIWRQKSPEIHELKFDPQDRFLAVCFREATQPLFGILDLATGQLLFQCATRGLARLAFGPAGNDLYVSTADTLWRYDCRQPQWTLPAAGRILPSLDQSVDRPRAIFCDADGRFVGLHYVNTRIHDGRQSALFDAHSLRPAADFDAILPSQEINLNSRSLPVLQSSRGRCLYSLGPLVFDVSLDGPTRGKTKSRELLTHSMMVDYLFRDPVAETVIAAADDGSVIFQTDAEKTQTLSHGAAISGLVVLPGGRFVTGGIDGLLKCWELSPRRALATNRDLAPDSASSHLVTFVGDRLLFQNFVRDRHFLIEPNSRSITTFGRPLPGKYGYAERFPRVRPGADELVVNSSEGLSLYPMIPRGIDVGKRRFVPAAMPYSVDFDAAGRVMAICHENGAVSVHDFQRDESLPVPEVSGLGFVAVNRAGTRAALLTMSGLEVWEIATGKRIGHESHPAGAGPSKIDVDGVPSLVGPPVFHPVANLVAFLETTPQASTCVIYDTDSGTRRTTLVGEPGQMFQPFVFSSDGERLIVPCNDARLRIWDWRIGRELLSLAEIAQCYHTAISSDGLLLAYAGWSPSLRIAEALPWSGQRDATFYGAVDRLRIKSSKMPESGQPEPEQRILTGDVELRRGDSAGALSAYRQAIERVEARCQRTPASVPNQVLLADLYAKMRVAARADGDLQEDQIVEHSSEFWARLPLEGPALRRQIDAQIELFDRRLRRNPASAIASLPGLLEHWLGRREQHPANPQITIALHRLLTRWVNAARTDQDSQSIEGFVARHPRLGELLGGVWMDRQDWGRAVAEFEKVSAREPSNSDVLLKLAQALQSAGRTRESIPVLERGAAANPLDVRFIQALAALQAWFGLEPEFRATQQQILAALPGAVEMSTVRDLTRGFCLKATATPEELGTVRTRAKKAFRLEGETDWSQRITMALVEFRTGHFEAAPFLLEKVTHYSAEWQARDSIALFLRAMFRQQQGDVEQARQLAQEAVTLMHPWPADEQNPLTGAVDVENLIEWLVCREAQALIGFEVPRPVARPL